MGGFLISIMLFQAFACCDIKSEIFFYDYFTHPGVSSLLKLLSDGLIRRHDNEHLDDHVEDGHGDQVGDVVPVEKGRRTRKGVRLDDRNCVSLSGTAGVGATPVSLAVVQGAAGPEGLVVVLPPADERHGGPEGAEQPDEDSQSDGGAPLQLRP